MRLRFQSHLEWALRGQSGAAADWHEYWSGVDPLRVDERLRSAAVFFGVREASKPCATELPNRCICIVLITNSAACYHFCYRIRISRFWPSRPTRDPPANTGVAG